jgi:hypothetical protein
MRGGIQSEILLITGTARFGSRRSLTLVASYESLFFNGNHVVVIPACPASFFGGLVLPVKNDPGHAGMTDLVFIVPNQTFVSSTKC